MSNFMKIRPMGTQLFHADRKSHDEATFAFRNFANAPKILFNILFFVIIPSSDNFSLIMRVVHITMISYLYKRGIKLLGLLTLESRTDGLSRHVSSCQSTLRDIPEEQRSQHIYKIATLSYQLIYNQSRDRSRVSFVLLLSFRRLPDGRIPVLSK
jgi:hypothetical protein